MKLAGIVLLVVVIGVIVAGRISNRIIRRGLELKLQKGTAPSTRYRIIGKR